MENFFNDFALCSTEIADENSLHEIPAERNFGTKARHFFNVLTNTNTRCFCSAFSDFHLQKNDVRKKQMKKKKQENKKKKQSKSYSFSQNSLQNT